MENAPVGNVKYDWYQTDSHVILNIFLKQVKPENVRIDLVNREFRFTAKLSEEEEVTLSLNLAHVVQPSEVVWKVMSSKIEVKLKKLESSHWDALESKVLEPAPVSDPTKLLRRKDWDKIALDIKKEEEQEQEEGEAALNSMFQKIYAGGSDETKKAMNKSFLESGGTVLSTSWDDVGSRKVDVKPPDGMEWKKWDS